MITQDYKLSIILTLYHRLSPTADALTVKTSQNVTAPRWPVRHLFYIVCEFIWIWTLTRFACFVYGWCNSDFREKLYTPYTTGVTTVYWDIILFTNPSARAGGDTRSIFKQSLTGLNSEFSFS